jgi:hypothetical protein
MAIGLSLLSLLFTLWAGDARCQTPASPAVDPKELHGGIEIALQAVRAIVLKVSTGADGETIGIQGYDQIIPSTPFPRDEKITPEYMRELAQSVQKLSERLQRDFGVPSHQIYLLGLSELVGQTRDDLAREARSKLGKEITFLDAKGETELNIAGNIPRRYPFDGKWFENRNISFLLDVGATNVKGGFQKLRLTTARRAEYDYVTWDIPIRGPLRAEMAQNPDLMWRKKVYLTGNILWALTTLLYPQEQEAFVPITIQDINNFYYRAMTDPEALLNPDLSKIRDENVRNEAKKGREAIKAIYTPKSLAAGADNLRVAATELSLGDKRLIFSRNSNFARLLSFIRLQID